MVNIQKVGKVCKKGKEIYLYTMEGRQWAGTAEAVYALDGCPEMRIEQLGVIMGIDADDMAEYTTGEFSGEPEKYADVTENDEPVHTGGIQIVAGGEVLEGVWSENSGESVYFRERMTAPVKKWDSMSLRHMGTETWVLLKKGLETEAIIHPITWARKTWTDEMKRAIRFFDGIAEKD